MVDSYYAPDILKCNGECWEKWYQSSIGLINKAIPEGNSMYQAEPYKIILKHTTIPSIYHT